MVERDSRSTSPSEFGGLIEKLNIDEDRKRSLEVPLARPGDLDGAEGEPRSQPLLRAPSDDGDRGGADPALVSLSPSDQTLEDVVRVATWVVSLVVAISAAVEQFFHFGDRWRNYRRTAERLKSEGGSTSSSAARTPATGRSTPTLSRRSRFGWRSSSGQTWTRT